MQLFELEIFLLFICNLHVKCLYRGSIRRSRIIQLTKEELRLVLKYPINLIYIITFFHVTINKFREILSF